MSRSACFIPPLSPSLIVEKQLLPSNDHLSFYYHLNYISKMAPKKSVSRVKPEGASVSHPFV